MATASHPVAGLSPVNCGHPSGLTHAPRRTNLIFSHPSDSGNACFQSHVKIDQRLGFAVSITLEIASAVVLLKDNNLDMPPV